MKLKQNKGNVWICTGLLLIAAALLLFCSNKIEDLHAQKSVRKVMEEISAKAPKAESKEVPVYPVDEEQEMPVETIDGKEYPMRDMNFPTVDPADPLRLTDEEEEL